MTWLSLFYNLGEVINFAKGGNLITFLGKIDLFEPRHEKTNVLVFDQVQHKPCCTATEDG